MGFEDVKGGGKKTGFIFGRYVVVPSSSSSSFCFLFVDEGSSLSSVGSGEDGGVDVSGKKIPKTDA